MNILKTYPRLRCLQNLYVILVAEVVYKFVAAEKRGLFLTKSASRVKVPASDGWRAVSEAHKNRASLAKLVTQRSYLNHLMENDT